MCKSSMWSYTAIEKSWADVSFSACSDLAVRIAIIVFEFEKWHESVLLAHISFIMPSIFNPPQCEKFLCSDPFTPPSSPVCTASVRLVYYNVCGWRNGVSVCPRGSSHTLLEGKGHTGLNTTQPSSFQAPLFTPSTTIVLGLCGTALFLSLTHPLTHNEEWW